MTPFSMSDCTYRHLTWNSSIVLSPMLTLGPTTLLDPTRQLRPMRDPSCTTAAASMTVLACTEACTCTSPPPGSHSCKLTFLSQILTPISWDLYLPAEDGIPSFDCLVIKVYITILDKSWDDKALVSSQMLLIGVSNAILRVGEYPVSWYRAIGSPEWLWNAESFVFMLCAAMHPKNPLSCSEPERPLLA